LRETLVRLALEEHLIAEGAGALALAAGRRVAGKRKCAVVSGGNIDAMVLAGLLSDVRTRAPRKPRRRAHDPAPVSDTRAALPRTSEAGASDARASEPRHRVARLPARPAAVASTSTPPGTSPGTSAESPDILVTPLEAIA
jgi:threonine dehydratase